MSPSPYRLSEVSRVMASARRTISVEHSALVGREILQCRDERQLDVLPAQVRRVGRLLDQRLEKYRSGNRDAQIGGVVARRRQVRRQYPRAASFGQPQADVGGDPVQPGAQRAAALEAVQATPGGEQCFLHRILGVLRGAEHPVAVGVQLTPVLGDDLIKIHRHILAHAYGPMSEGQFRCEPPEQDLSATRVVATHWSIWQVVGLDGLLEGEPRMPPAELRTDIPHSARIYDYVLGGKDNFEVDRIAAEKMLQSMPGLRTSMRANRRFMVKAARYLANQGFRQFLDIGTGLPTHPNLHEVVQGVAPDAKIVYVDNDPLVLVHARALLTPVGTGSVSYLDADLKDPDAIFAAPQVANEFDLSRPVAVTMIAVLQHITDEKQARTIVETIMDRLPPGSALALSAVTTENDPIGEPRTVNTYNKSGVPVKPRSRGEVAALFGDLQLVDPGVVFVHQWHADDEDRATDDKAVAMYGGVAYKP
jgi:O-methyltransferase involved in polyketide biosynthesis